MNIFFFFNDTATTEIYTLSLHDALPISRDLHHARDELRVEDSVARERVQYARAGPGAGLLHSLLRGAGGLLRGEDRKSTRLNSSHANISYAVFCLKKKKI